MAVVTIFYEHGLEYLEPWQINADCNPVHFSEVAGALEKHAIEVAVVLCYRDVESALAILASIKTRYPSTAVIFITAHSSEDVVTKAFKMGARDYFKIPFDPKVVAESLEMLLEFKRQPAVQPKMAVGAAARAVPEGITRAIRFMEDNLTGALSLDLVAAAGYMSKYHFCRLFKQHVGVSPLQFYTARRIEKAKEFLREGDCTISRAAFKSGFNDLSDFCRQFKKVTGITPKMYRSSLVAKTDSGITKKLQI